VPLIISTGAGSEMRRTLGTAVFGGMLGVTLFGILLTPVFFFSIDWLGETRLFHSRLAHKVGAIALDIVAPRSVVRGAAHAVRAIASRNGHGQSNGQANKERGRVGDKETGRQGDRNGQEVNNGQADTVTRRPGDKETGRPEDKDTAVVDRGT